MNNPTVLFQGMIAPLVPYAIRGAIWYQGESNANTPSLYAQMLPALIADWRSHWGQGDFPFLFVQLPNLNTVTDWAAMREAQARALAVPKTGMVVTLDVGDPKDIHPRRKAEVGARLALAARRVAYDQELVSSGPTFERMQIEGERVRLSFQNVGGGLMAVPGGDGGLKGFVVAGSDGIFWPAEGRIENASVVVWSDAVKQPVAVRYGWASNPEVDLFNQEGLPAAPFRTDQWPLKR
jgi:sialate O-acetylesterase